MMLRVLVCLVLVGVAVAQQQVHNPWIRVPGGELIHKSCIRTVAPGELVDTISPCPYKAKLSMPLDQMYSMDVHYTPASEIMTDMNATFKVPALPKQNDGQVLYFWPGFKSTEPTMGLPVLQPVLQFGGCQTDGWCLRSWFVYGDQGIAVNSEELEVNVGDTITSYMSYDSSAQIWTIYSYDATTAQNSTLFISHSDVVNTDFHVAMLVLETIMDQSVCADLPTDNTITFTGVSVNRKKVQWTDRTQDTQCGEKIDDQSTTVTFHWSS